MSHWLEKCHTCTHACARALMFACMHIQWNMLEIFWLLRQIVFDICVHFEYLFFMTASLLAYLFVEIIFSFSSLSFFFSFFFFFYFCVWHFKTIFFTHSSTILVQLVSLILLFQVTNHRWDVSWLCCIQTIEELTEYYNWLGSVADLIKNWKAWECIMQWSNMKNKYGLACHSLSHNVKISICMHW